MDSPSWVEGSSIRHLLDNPLARPGLVREAFLLLPESLLSLMTWGVLTAEILFLPLGLWSRSRPWIWLCMVLMHFGILLVIDFADISFGMLMIHLFTFAPDWFPPKKPTKPAVLAFDGDCLMCSRSIRLLAEEDPSESLRFTPLQSPKGTSMKKNLGATGERIDSILLESDGRIFARSDAVLTSLEILGGHWRFLAMVAKCLPRRIRDGIYNAVAKNRHRITKGKPVCQLPSEALTKRLM